MFWFWTSRGITSASGFTYGERQLAMSAPDFIEEFQGDAYGCSEFGKRNCGRPCGRGHVATSTEV